MHGRALRCCLLLGAALRLWHYVRNPSVWHDEAALILNVLHQGYAECWGPLIHAEAAPPLFLWLEKAVIGALGDSTYALRLLPLLASLGTLFLVADLARCLLRPWAAVGAVALLAVSDHLLWHACEAKPYAVDVFLAALVPWLHVHTMGWHHAWRCSLFLAVAPAVILLSFPGCFICGGLWLAWLPRVCQGGRFRDLLGFALLTFAIGATFLLLLAGPAHAQRCPAMVQCWESAFIPWHQPWRIPIWSLSASLELFRYSCEPLGSILLLPFLIGSYQFWRGQREMLILLLAPVGLAAVASGLHAYPFGGARVLAYAAPCLAILAAAGGEWLLRRITLHCLAEPAGKTRLVNAGVAVMVLAAPLAAGGLALLRVLQPWPRADCVAAAAFVRAQHQPGEAVVCNHWEYAYYFRDLNRDFHLLDGRPLALDGRVWLLSTAAKAQDRQAVLETLPPGGWRVLRQRSYERTTVSLLVRSGTLAAVRP